MQTNSDPGKKRGEPGPWRVYWGERRAGGGRGQLTTIRVNFRGLYPHHKEENGISHENFNDQRRESPRCAVKARLVGFMGEGTTWQKLQNGEEKAGLWEKGHRKTLIRELKEPPL